MNLIDEKLNAFKIYEDGTDLLGVADITLPSLEYMTETVKGAGIAGEINSPAVGQFSSMSVTLNWRAVVKKVMTLMQPKAHHLDCRGSIQRLDSGSGEIKQVPVKVVVRGLPKKGDLGKMESAGKMDSSNELEVIYLKVDLDGENIAEIDKFNYICHIGGVDYMAGIKSALGMD